jgi:multiple sugar transport system substrate-binding protein
VRAHAALPLVLAGALALTACGSNAEPTDPATPEPLALTVQAAGGEGELKAVQSLLDAFEKSKPGLEISFTGIPSQGDHIAKLATSFAGGKPPDVFLLNYRRLGQFVERGVVLPPSTDGLEGLYEQPLEAFEYDGKPACLPTNASSTVAYVNTKLFADAGVPLPKPEWTWTDLTAAAQALHAKGTKAVGFEVGIRNSAPFIWTAGGEVVDDTEQPTRMTLDTPQAKEALAYLSSLQQFGVDATARAAAEPVDLFEQGELAVFFDSRRSVPAFRKAEGLQFDVLPLPRKDVATPSTTLLGSDAYCVAKASKSPRLAAELARFAVTGEGATILAESGRTVPVLKSLAESPAFLAPDKAPRSAQVFVDAIATTKRLPNVAGQDEAEEAADDLLTQYFAGKAALDATVTKVGEDTAAVYAQER